jgi:hypothetical protein
MVLVNDKYVFTGILKDDEDKFFSFNEHTLVFNIARSDSDLL